MSIFLILTAFIQAPIESQQCEHLNAAEVSSLVRQADGRVALSPYGYGATRSLSDLVNYWRGTCSDERFKASKRTVKELSGLLRYWTTRHLVPLMLLDVGPNLAAAKQDVDVAIIDQAAREDAMIKAAAPILPESGIGVANMLRCVRHKMDTGELDPKLCWASWNGAY
jgi:hypothetical protein